LRIGVDTFHAEDYMAAVKKESIPSMLCFLVANFGQ
jgi:hypothetical protein